MHYDGRNTYDIDVLNYISAGSELRKLEIQVIVVFEVEDYRQYARDTLSDNSGNGSTLSFHSRETEETKYQDWVKNDIGDGTYGLSDHGLEGTAGGLKQSLKDELCKYSD